MFDSALWVFFNGNLTTWVMGWTYVSDQDISVACAANYFENIDEDTRTKVDAESPSPVYISPKKKRRTSMSKLHIFEQETRKLGFHIGDYYLFQKTWYIRTILRRLVIWEIYGVLAGFACYYIPFWGYQYGIANKSGKTEDLFATSFASYSAMFLIHTFQILLTIRNFTPFLLAAIITHFG